MTAQAAGGLLTTVSIPGTAAMKKTFCEFFAGIGLVRAALSRGGWQCLYANDIDPKKESMHAGHFGPSERYHLGDVWDTESVCERIAGRPTLATASFPCTDMSLAGKRAGLAGDQSGALLGFLRVLEELAERRPAMILLENVPGFLSSRGGADFAAAVNQLAALGYWIDSFVLDARSFVPQSRQRLFVVGYSRQLVDDATPLVVRRSDCDALCDPWHEAIRRSERIRPSQLRRAMDRIELETGWATVDCGNPRPASYRLADYLDDDELQSWWPAEEVERHHAMMSDGHRRQVEQIVAEASEVAPLTGFRRVRQSQQRLEVRFDGVAGCLRTPRGGSAKQIVLFAGRGELRMRWMSPREYARLQGAPDYTLPANDIQAWFGFGDAVCVPAIQWIDRQMLSPVLEANRASGFGLQPSGRRHEA
jgi:DNA (cytosine-5)-methyltransferase 1